MNSDYDLYKKSNYSEPHSQNRVHHSTYVLFFTTKIYCFPPFLLSFFTKLRTVRYTCKGLLMETALQSSRM